MFEQNDSAAVNAIEAALKGGNSMDEQKNLNWIEAERLNNNTEAANIPCFEASVPGGKYRAAPVMYIADDHGNRCLPYVGYEAFFIPAGAELAADVRDIAEFLKCMDRAKAVALDDYRQARH